MMKKQYEQPMAEKIDFNYKETIVASDTPGTGNNKGGNFGRNCFTGKFSTDTPGCSLKP